MGGRKEVHGREVELAPPFRTVQNSQPVSAQDIFPGRVAHTTATGFTLVGEHDAAMRTLKKAA